MKSCPSCNRTFDDTMTFCLVDGSVLSAPNDPNETLGVTTPHVTGPPPTAILNPTTNPGGPRLPQLSTIVSPQPLPLYSPKRQPQLQETQSGKPWLVIGIAVSVVLLIVVGAVLGFVWLGKDDAAGEKSDSKIVNANVSSSTDCFAGDTRARSTDRGSHYSWAKGQNTATLEGNLKHKVDLLFQCSSMDGEKLSNVFADISVIVARYVPDANCFGGDAGVAATVWADHKAWGLSKGADIMRENLRWKIAAALKCLDRSNQMSFFADVSVAIARAPYATTATTGDGGWGATNERASLNGERLTYYPGTTAEQCKADCDKDTRCNGFTFIRAGAYNPNDSAMCYQMSVAKEMVPHSCCISAIKR